MLSRRRVLCLGVIGSLFLGVTGCGGSAPSTGEVLKVPPNNEALGKAMAEGYMKKAAEQAKKK